MIVLSRRWAAILVVFLGWALGGAEAVFPVDTIRVPILFNSNVNVASPSMAWFVMGLSLQIVVLAFYLGLPRTPQRPSIRKRSLRDREYPDIGPYLDIFVDMDRGACLSRLICHLQSMPGRELSFFQKIFLDSVWSSSDLDRGYSPIISPRRKLINAAHFGKSTGCTSCCKFLYKSCSASTKDLLSLL